MFIAQRDSPPVSLVHFLLFFLNAS
jgi:hypothetical protein